MGCDPQKGKLKSTKSSIYLVKQAKNKDFDMEKVLKTILYEKAARKMLVKSKPERI